MILNDILFSASLDEIIDELQSQLQINGIQLLSSRKDTPDNVMVSCPYHKGGQERRPSMGIKKSNGTCHCFTCGTVATLQQMISHCFGHDSELGGFGWNWLLKNFITVGVEERPDIELDFSRQHTTQTHNYVSEEELDQYREYHPYMWKRKLTPNIVELFDIGYDKKTQCITFPIRDVRGNTLFVARRSVHTKYFNYPAGAEKPVYGLYELECINAWEKYRVVKLDGSARGLDELIICESMIDALTCWVYGRPAVALNGLGNELQFRQLNKLPCRKFILATDADSAGMKARSRIRSKIEGKIITEYVWDVNAAKDINDMSKEMFDNLEEFF